jgi:hypothetical protein
MTVGADLSPVRRLSLAVFKLRRLVGCRVICGDFLKGRNLAAVSSSFACGQGSLMSVWEQSSRVVVPLQKTQEIVRDSLRQANGSDQT